MTMQETINRPLLLLIALIQGLALFWLRESSISETWPYGIRVIELVLWSLAVAVPVLLLMVLNRQNQRRALVGAGIYATVLALVAAYTGWQLEPDGIIRHSEEVVAIWCVTMAVLWFKVAMYLRIWAEGERVSYVTLFRYSWRNLLLLAVCFVFVQITWAILLLWGALFNLVGIDFFEKIFRESWFLFPALALANGLAFVIFRELVDILDTLSRVLRALCLFLLPVLVFVELLFLASLPFAGISALWDTGHGTALALSLQLLILLFFNATFQTDADSTTYPPWLRRFVHAGLLALPAYALIAIYGLWLRVEQYGLTLDRLWAATLVGLVALLAFAYAINLLWLRGRAAGERFGLVNVAFGLVVMMVMLLVNSPLLDFRKISVHSQVARLERGDITLEELDVRYFASSLARPGYLALESISAPPNEDEGEGEGEGEGPGESEREAFARRVEVAYRPPAAVRDEVQVIPEGARAPESLVSKVMASGPPESRLRAVYLLRVDMDKDGEEDEWLSFYEADRGVSNDHTQLWFQLEDGGWKGLYVRSDIPKDTNNLGELLQALRPEAPRWQILRSGDIAVQVYEAEELEVQIQNGFN